MARVRGYKKQVGEKLFIYLVVALMSALYLLFVGACEKQPSSSIKEQDEALYKAGQAQLARGDYNSALKAFLRLIDERRDCPQSHLEAGRIYLFKLKDCVYAIYYFRKFIEMQSVLDPHSPLIPNVKQMIETAQKTMIVSLPQSPYEDNSALEGAVAKLKQENYELKQNTVSYISTIKALEARVASSTSATTSNAQGSSTTSSRSSRSSTPSASTANSAPTATTTPASTSTSQRRIARSVEELRSPTVQRDIPSTYTVKAGDTLSTISRKVYGTSARWNEIYRYNTATLSHPEKLKVGQVLRIPR